MLAKFQEEAIRFLEAGYRTIYADPPGTRKTATSLSWAGPDARILAVVPANVLGHWQRQAELWVPGLPAVRYRGSDTQAQREKAIETWRAQSGLLVVNYEAMRRDQEELSKFRPDYLLVDEAHRVKNRKSQTRTAIKTLARRAGAHAWISGSPILNHPEELWSTLNLIDPKGYPAYWRWANEHYFVQITTFHGKLRQPAHLVGDLRPGAAERIQASLMGVLLQRPMFYLLPELGDEPIVTTMPIDLSPEERRQYRKMAEYGWVEVGGAALVAPNAAVQQGRLRQLASDWSAFWPDEAPGSKVKAAVALAEDIGEPVVLFVGYRATAKALQRQIPGSVVYTGAETDDEREKARLAFIEGKSRAIIGTLGAMGASVDGLQGASRHLIFLDLDWTPDINRQAVGRLWRSGQTGAVQVYALAANETVDMVVAQANEEKRAVIDLITGQSWQNVVRGVLR